MIDQRLLLRQLRRIPSQESDSARLSISMVMLSPCSRLKPMERCVEDRFHILRYRSRKWHMWAVSNHRTYHLCSGSPEMRAGWSSGLVDKVTAEVIILFHADRIGQLAEPEFISQVILDDNQLLRRHTSTDSNTGPNTCPTLPPGLAQQLDSDKLPDLGCIGHTGPLDQRRLPRSVDTQSNCA